MATTKYREGSQGAAEQKYKRTFLIVAGVIWLIIILLIAGIIPSYIGDRAAAVGLRGLAILFVLISYAAIYFHDRLEPKNSQLDWLPAVIIVAFLIVGILTAVGFNFDLAGI